MRKKAVKSFNRNRRKVQKILSKKKNQRKLIYILALLLIVGFAYYGVQAEARANEREQMLQEATEQAYEERQELIQSLEELEQEKVNTETELKEKTRREAEKQREIKEKQQKIHELERELQAKREREAEERRIAAAQRTTAQRAVQTVSPRRVSASANIAGNTYSYGYCTWYVKNRRPDIPNGLGNANMWLHNARSIGIPTGSTPRVGAVAQTSGGSLGHVAIVESVNGDGTVTISEMNFTGWNQVSRRTTSASSFNYIY